MLETQCHQSKLFLLKRHNLERKICISSYHKLFKTSTLHNNGKKSPKKLARSFECRSANLSGMEVSRLLLTKRSCLFLLKQAQISSKSIKTVARLRKTICPDQLLEGQKLSFIVGTISRDNLQLMKICGSSQAKTEA